MAKKSGLGGKFFVHGYDISGDVGSLSRISANKRTFDSTGIDVSGAERITAHGDGVLEFASWFNDATEKGHEALKSIPTTDVIGTYLQGTSQGDQAACLVSKQNNYDHDRNADGSLAATVTLEADATPLEWCELLSVGLETFASSGTGTAKDDSSSSANGLRAYLQIVDIDSGTPTVTIEESSDDGATDAYTTLLSFTAVASGNEPTAERKTVTGAIEQYLQINVTGTFTNADIVVAYQRGTANDDTDLS